MTGIVVRVLCRPPLGTSLSWPQLWLGSAFFVLTAACVHGTAVWAACRASRSRTSRGLIASTWAAVAWLPALALFAYEQSPWIAAIVPLAMVNAAFFLRRTSEEPTPEPEAPKPTELFGSREVSPQWPGFVPAAITAAALQLGVFAIALNRDWLAACLLGCGCAIAAWQIATTRQRRNKQPSFVARTLLAVFVTAIALLPFLRAGSSFPGFAGSNSQTTGNRSGRRITGEGGLYTGIVLVAPVKPHPVIIPPKAKDEGLSSRVVAKPLVIDFDGAYWYFKQPDVRPEPDAKVVHGDPLKAHYRSTNRRPLTMEAHQPLNPPIPFGCCREIGVRMVNAETREGVIAIEVRLQNRITNESVSLGAMVLASSVGPDVPPDRLPVRETLTFRIPASAPPGQFDEITVAVRPTVGNSQVGSKVGVESFILIP